MLLLLGCLIRCNTKSIFCGARRVVETRGKSGDAATSCEARAGDARTAAWVATRGCYQTDGRDRLQPSSHAPRSSTYNENARRRLGEAAPRSQKCGAAAGHSDGDHAAPCKPRAGGFRGGAAVRQPGPRGAAGRVTEGKLDRLWRGVGARHPPVHSGRPVPSVQDRQRRDVLMRRAGRNLGAAARLYAVHQAALDSARAATTTVSVPWKVPPWRQAGVPRRG